MLVPVQFCEGPFFILPSRQSPRTSAVLTGEEDFVRVSLCARATYGSQALGRVKEQSLDSQL